MRTLSRADKERFERDGVLELGRVVSDGELAELRERMDRIFYNGSEPNSIVRDLSELKGEQHTYSSLQVVNLHEIDQAFKQLSIRNDLLDAVELILGCDLLLLRDQAFYKPARFGSEVYMHQDNRYWHLEPPLAVTVWIALDDATEESGCLYFLPGSHRRGRIEHTRAAEGRSILLEAVADKADGIPIEVPAGYATMHDCQVLHWSGSNHSARPRRAHTIEYVAASATCRGNPLTDRPVLRRTPRPVGVVEGQPRGVV